MRLTKVGERLGCSICVDEYGDLYLVELTGISRNDLREVVIHSKLDKFDMVFVPLDEEQTKLVNYTSSRV